MAHYRSYQEVKQEAKHCFNHVDEPVSQVLVNNIQYTLAPAELHLTLDVVEKFRHRAEALSHDLIVKWYAEANVRNKISTAKMRNMLTPEWYTVPHSNITQGTQYTRLSDF